MKRTRLLLNPFLIYATVFTVALLLYAVKWLEYPNLSPLLFIFLISNIVGAVVLGCIPVNGIHLVTSQVKDPSFIKRVIVCLSVFTFLGLLISFIIGGVVPLYKILFSEDNYNYYYDFRSVRYLYSLASTLNSALVTLNLFMFLKSKQKIYLVLFIIGVCFCILYGSRGYFIVSLLPSILVYLSRVKFTLKRSISVSILLLSSLYVFGVYGDLRESAKERTNVSLYATLTGEETTDYLSKAFIWSYFYYTSPIAKLEYVMQDPAIEALPVDYKAAFFYSILPYTISSRLYPDYYYNKRNSSYVYPDYYAGTAYDKVYLYAGRIGMIIYALALFLIVYLIMVFVKRRGSPFAIPIVATLSTVMALSVFDNMLVFTPLIFPLNYLIVIGEFINLRQKIKK